MTTDPAARASRAIVALATAFAASVLSVSAQSSRAGGEYAKAQAREAALRAEPAPPADDLRAAARAYEQVVRRYPTSGYADNALWQAAGLWTMVAERSGEPTDTRESDAALRWLVREYPSSPFRRDAQKRLSSGVPSESRPSAGLAIEGLDVEGADGGERVTIRLSGDGGYTSDRVSRPDRLFFDFLGARLAADAAARARSFSTPFVKSVRFGQPVAGVTRVVLELAGSPYHVVTRESSPSRLVVMLTAEPPATPDPAPVAPPPPATAGPPAAGPPLASPAPFPRVPAAPPAASRPVAGEPATSGGKAEASAPIVSLPLGPPAPPPSPSLAGAVPSVPPAAPAITAHGDYSLARQLGLRVARIVIDPGHGGHDPGAQAHGLSEAELVLDVALRLEKLLTRLPGVEVVLTRRTNEFIPLEERTAIANQQGADLFLSIHANASRTPSVRGVETYFLNFATNPTAEAVAARENATSAQTMGALPAILRAIALNNKLSESRELATILQTSMVRRLRGQSKGVKDLGVKQAPFVVLIGAQMPSVLAEVSFLTNRAEAGLLKQAAYRQHIAQALADGVVKYQASLKKVTFPESDGRR
jgi:N-acetylmuramoyl-L-alanine amidase